MKDDPIENNIYLARVSHLSGMPEEAIKYIEELIKLKNGHITEEERNILFSSLKTLINSRRDSWRTVNALESKEIKNQSTLLPRITELKLSLSSEIEQYINKGIELIDNSLFKAANNDELKVMYAKIKGDYMRYMIELKPKDKKEEINMYKEKADENYKIGLNMCNSLSNLNTTKIGLILNYTVFMYEILKDYKNAYIIANNVYQATLKSLNDDNYDLTLLKDLNKLVNLLKENISKWSEAAAVQEKIENLKDGLEPENHENN
jgi:hypothetical protein